MAMQIAGGGFYLFAALVFFLFWLAAGSRRVRLAVLLLANYVFCAQFGVFYALLLPACSLVDYSIGLGLMRSTNPFLRRALVTASVALNIGLLAGSRHMPWFLQHAGVSQWDWVFPLGLSFYAFQAHLHSRSLPPRR